MKHILVTGDPGIGKTTMVKKVIDHLKEQKLEVDGFITEELRNAKFQRIGFGVRIISSNATAILANKNPPSANTKTLGQYTVYVKDFENLVLQPLLSIDKGVIIIDEIGKMELFSKRFEEAISTIFKNKNVHILATVPVKGPSFVERLKTDYDSRMITVTKENRDNLVSEISSLLIKK